MQFSGSKETGDPIPFLSFKIAWGTLIPEDTLFLVQFTNSMVSGTENSISGFPLADLGFNCLSKEFYEWKVCNLVPVLPGKPLTSVTCKPIG